MEFSGECRWPAGGDQPAQGTGGRSGVQASLLPSRSRMGEMGWVVVGEPAREEPRGPCSGIWIAVYLSP